MRRWALVSVYDKRGVVEFCRRLAAIGYGLLSTGGTAKLLTDAGLAVTPVEAYTGFPEMLDGRVKTLHPRVHGGILGRRDSEAHVAQMEAHGIDRIDLVVVSLYPFVETVARAASFEECVEMIDIGGPAMLRAAAKNHAGCIPVCDPDDYDAVATALESGGLTSDQRLRLAQKAFATTAAYDAAVAAYLAQQLERAKVADTAGGTAAAGAASTAHAAAAADAADAAGAAPSAVGGATLADQWPPQVTLSFISRQPLRYGENPHQRAHFYAEPDAPPSTIAGARQLQGKELSYNNIQDADAALAIVRAFDDTGLAVAAAVKHMNPCGVGTGATVHEAFERAYESDPVSIFGGILCFNRPVDGPLASRLTDMFLEIVIAPAFTDEALEAFRRKKNVRLLVVDMEQPQWRPGDRVFKRVSGGLLVQEVDLAPAPDWQVVTRRAPTDAERRALDFAWRVVRFVKSNAIVVATEHMTLGVGAGQMNRVGAARIAIEQAGPRAKGAVLASDAFFPMRDTVDTAAAAGITAIIQPGGSIRDKESIEAADEHGIAMVFTGQRHFLH